MDERTAELEAHPAQPCAHLRRVTASIGVGRSPQVLRICFRVEGDIARLRLPERGAAQRRDGLWQHTCFEAFLRPDASVSYHEFNFAPSGDWAAYRFGAPRGDCTLPAMPAPSIRFDAGADHCTLAAELDVAAIPDLARAAALAAGLAAVIETTAGDLSYWALAHTGPRPDFHDPATFRLRLEHA